MSTNIKDRLFTRSYVCIVMANFLLYFGFWLLIPVLPFYLKEVYGCAEGIIGAVLSCYIVSSLIVRPFSGFLLDIFPRKPLYILAYLAFTTIFLGYIVSGTLLIFIMLRAFHGLAFGAVSVGGNTVVVDIMPSSRRGEGIGYYGLSNNVAMSIGPMTGLFLHGVLSFETIFFIAFLSCFLGWLFALCVKVSRKARVGTAVFSLDRFVLLKGLPASLTLMLLSVPYGAMTNFVAMYADSIGLDVSTGFFFTVMAVGMGVSRIFAGKLVDRGFITQTIGRGLYLAIIAFLMLSSLEYLILWNREVSTVIFFIVPFLQGVGFGMIFPAYNSLYINLAPRNRRATATSTYLTSWDVGIGLGMLLGGLIAEHFSFGTVYFAGGVLSIISMVYFHRVVAPHYKKNNLYA